MSSFFDTDVPLIATSVQIPPTVTYSQQQQTNYHSHVEQAQSNSSWELFSHLRRINNLSDFHAVSTGDRLSGAQFVVGDLDVDLLRKSWSLEPLSACDDPSYGGRSAVRCRQRCGRLSTGPRKSFTIDAILGLDYRLGDERPVLSGRCSDDSGGNGELLGLEKNTELPVERDERTVSTLIGNNNNNNDDDWASLRNETSDPHSLQHGASDGFNGMRCKNSHSM